MHWLLERDANGFPISVLVVEEERMALTDDEELALRRHAAELYNALAWAINSAPDLEPGGRNHDTVRSKIEPLLDAYRRDPLVGYPQSLKLCRR